MAIFTYRAVSPGGQAFSGEIEAESPTEALAGVRRKGLSPIELRQVAAATRAARAKVDGKSRAAVTKSVGELAVLIGAGLQLDRALALAIENVEHGGVRLAFAAMLIQVREGKSLSSAMAGQGDLFSPMAIAMTEAGEADGCLGEALDRLAAALAQADELRTLIGTAMIYPIILTVIAVLVILMMLLFVVPQFETLFAGAGERLPASSRIVMAASQGLRAHGVAIFGGVIVAGVAFRQLLRAPGMRLARDQFFLGLPQIGTLIRYIDTARFARTLAALVTGGVALPNALAMAQGAISNKVIGDAVAAVASGVKEGEGLTSPLASTGVFPKLALGFLRTGEETSQLGPMLGKLADVLDRDIKVRIQRLIGLLTPAITVILGVTVAAIIASIMAAILGFNDLAVS